MNTYEKFWRYAYPRIIKKTDTLRNLPLLANLIPPEPAFLFAYNSRQYPLEGNMNVCILEERTNKSSKMRRNPIEMEFAACYIWWILDYSEMGTSRIRTAGAYSTPSNGVKSNSKVNKPSTTV